MSIAYKNPPFNSYYQDQNGVVGAPTTNNTIINISISCQNLPKLDSNSPSDPMVVLEALDNYTQSMNEVDRTEVVMNNPNPSFVHSFQAVYRFETIQPLRFCVYDSDSHKVRLDEHDFIGSVETDVQTMVSNLQMKQEFKINSPKAKGATMTIVAEQVPNSVEVMELCVAVNRLKRMRTFSKNYPFLIVFRASESGTKVAIYRTEVIPRCLTGTFKKFRIPMGKLCGNNLDMPLIFTIFDYHRSKAPEVIGSFQATVRELPNLINKQNELINPKLKKAKTLGSLVIKRANIRKEPSFVDYIEDGMKIKLITAVDFTGSNGEPNHQSSLHYISPNGQLNQYQRAIWQVGNILCPYDYNRKFPVYGFGASVHGFANHCFALNGHDKFPEVDDLAGIMDIYSKAIKKYSLSGPTIFSEIIKKARKTADENWKKNKTYTILMILTDGIINDMDQTINEIVKASETALSIIIIGVGQADFSAMDELDGDGGCRLVSSKGYSAARDIVQFVPFLKYLENDAGLAAAVLAEVPTQIIDFCFSVDYFPARN